MFIKMKDKSGAEITINSDKIISVEKTKIVKFGNFAYLVMNDQIDWMLDEENYELLIKILIGL